MEEKGRIVGRKKKIIILLISLIVLAAILLLIKDNKKLDKNIKVTEEDGFTALNFETPYATLKYPEEWRDSMYVREEHDETAGTYTLSLYYKGEGGEAEVAKVYIGQEDKGLLVGVLSAEGEQKPVSMEFGTLEGDGWTEEDENNYGIMQEEMNVMLQCMIESGEFTFE